MYPPANSQDMVRKYLNFVYVLVAQYCIYIYIYTPTYQLSSSMTNHLLRELQTLDMDHTSGRIWLQEGAIFE